MTVSPHSSEPMVARWFVRNPDDLIWLDWDDASTLYDCRTGQTHILGLFPAELLRLVSRQPGSTGLVSKEMAVACDADPDAEWQSKVVMVLRDLERLGLLERLDDSHALS